MKHTSRPPPREPQAAAPASPAGGDRPGGPGDGAWQEARRQRAAAPTMPLTPPVEWEIDPRMPPGREQPSSERIATAPRAAVSGAESPMAAALQEQIWSGLAMGPADTAQTGPHLPVLVHGSHPAARSPAPGAAPTPRTGPMPAARQLAPPPPTASADAGRVPLGYVVASAFFLAIAAAGFGLWLAFEVISL